MLLISIGGSGKEREIGSICPERGSILDMEREATPNSPNAFQKKSI